MRVWNTPTARLIRATGLAYLQPLVYMRSLVAKGLRKIWPTAGNACVNFFFSLLLLVTAFAAGVLADMSSQTGLGRARQIYRTALGETRYEQLADGSDVYLAPLSQLNVQFAGGLRAVVLVQGEAYFEVKHAATPFQVRAGEHVVRDLGTRFNVRALSGGSIEVMVSEGSVAVFHERSAIEPDVPPRELRLSAGQFASVKGESVFLRRLSQEDIEARLAWRKRRFLFRGEGLAVAVEDMNRFSPRNIVIDDPAIADLAIGGSFDVDQVNLLIDELRHFGVQHRVVDRNGMQEIHLFGGSGAAEPPHDRHPR